VAEKPIDWRGSSLKDIKDDTVFTPSARKEAGFQLSLIQQGLEPDSWKSFDIVGSGTKEIRINLDDGWFRVMYVAKFEEAVYVLHCFKKKTTATSKKDKDITSERYKAVIAERLKRGTNET
jgi:phage-related protein